ncbi:MAG TPA: S8/S53 family peptidase [Chryseolinea sp.]|nr:S8/S53 family peptidase [Chryseolinea sp.]HPM31410.1 S8/S53 family peptidase [Chryseolinea sp.]
MSRLIYFAVFLFISSSSFAAVNRYVVFFKDKVGSSYSVSNPLVFLSQRAIDRRTKQSIVVTETDFPVNQNYIDGVKATGAETYFQSRWMNALLVQCDASLLPTIEALTYVDHIEFVAPNAKLLINGRKKEIERAQGSKATEATDIQLQQIGIDKMHEDGFRGEGMLIAIFDDGFQGVNTALPFQPLFDESRIDLTTSKDFVFNTSNIFQYDDHGTQVFSVIAAFQSGTFTGGAYNARYQLYVTEDVAAEYRIEEYNWLFAAERADSAGVDVINSSLGYYDFDNASMDYAKTDMDGITTVISRAAQLAADRGMLIVCSAGNEGGIAWQIITAPADAKDVLAIANVNSSGVRSGSSSIGPSADGRIKPDVAAMGSGTSVIQLNGSLGSSSGTSLSAPLITSLVAGLWQRYPSLTSKEIMNAIRQSASQAANPDNFIGYGIPNYQAAVNYIERQSQENIFEVYPNPIQSGSVFIQPYDPNEVSSCRIQLISATGQLVYDDEISFSWINLSTAIDVSPLSSGLYFLRIFSNNKRFTYKLVKI